jgi:hypothetical protein
MKTPISEQLQIAMKNKQKAFEDKDSKRFNFWVTQVELLKIRSIIE